MMMTIRAVLLTLILMASYLVGQAQEPQIDANGWKMIYVTWISDKDSKRYGEPSIVFFVKDYPYKVGQEYPKLLQKMLIEGITKDQAGVDLSKTLFEFDCRRELGRPIRSFWSDGTESERSLSELGTWMDVHPGTPLDAMMKYACRPRTSPKR